MSGIGMDFEVFWRIGQAILAGLDPYAVEGSYYPPSTTLLFTIVALLPLIPSLAIWTGLNLFLFVLTVRRVFNSWRGLVWLGFAPTVGVLLLGQNDIIFLWLTRFLLMNGWKAALAGALLTLKPQLALIIMPWFGIRWLMKDRVLLARCFLLTVIIHSLPLLVDPSLYPRSFQAMTMHSGWRLLASPGIFTLTNFAVPVYLIAILALAAVVWGLFQDTLSSWTAQLFALPMGLWYDNVLLIGAVPARVFIPLSWAAFITAALVKNSVPLAVIPIAALAWRLALVYRDRRISPAIPAAES